jgi:hypothetical protein
MVMTPATADQKVWWNSGNTAARKSKHSSDALSLILSTRCTEGLPRLHSQMTFNSSPP